MRSLHSRGCGRPVPVVLERLERRLNPGFLEPLAFAVPGGLPWSVAVGEFSGDGIQDLAVANQTDNGTVSVLLGNGDGSFQEPQNFAVGRLPSSVAVGDVNNDGLLDLVVANYGSRNVGVLLGNGDGSFQDAQNFAVAAAVTVAIGDLNGDDFPDLVAAGPVALFSSLMSVLLGTGDGSFETAHSYADTGFALSVAVGDVDGDGFLDLALPLALPYDSSSVSVRLGNGDGSFRAGQPFRVAGLPTSVALADLNEDDLLDLAVVSVDRDYVSVLLGNGDGSFQDIRAFPTGNQPYSLVTGDVNGDGLLDLAAGSYFSDKSGSVSVLLGSGDGSFQDAQVFPAGSFPASVALEDFNGDHFPDLAVANSFPSTVSILLNDGIWGGGSPGGGSAPEGRADRTVLDVFAGEMLRNPGPASAFAAPAPALPGATTLSAESRAERSSAPVRIEGVPRRGVDRLFTALGAKLDFVWDPP